MQILNKLGYKYLRDVPIGTKFQHEDCLYTVVEHCQNIAKTIVEKKEPRFGYTYLVWHNILLEDYYY